MAQFDKNDMVRGQLRDYMKDRKVKYITVAKGAGMKPRTLYMFMNGYVNISLPRLYAILKYLGAEIRIVSRYGKRRPKKFDK